MAGDEKRREDGRKEGSIGERETVRDVERIRIRKRVLDP